MNLLRFWLAHRAELLQLVVQHLQLAATATATATALGVPLGVAAARRPTLGVAVGWIANVVQTIPSLAMFGFLLAIPLVGGLGARPAVIALALYGVLPVLRGTLTGITGVDRSIVEAGTAMGMTSRQLLWSVELPLALPSIVAGVRTSGVIAVGTAAIAAAVGAGGLGEYIFRGLSMVDSTVILAGAVPAALLALCVDAALAYAGRLLTARRRAGAPRIAVAAVCAIALLVGAIAAASVRTNRQIVVGSKNFTEQLILGELTAQAIERFAGLSVERKLNLGGTLICENALKSGDMDVYVEYTGTALTAVFKLPLSSDPAVVFEAVRDAYARSGRTALGPLGFNNTFAMLVRGADARRLNLKTMDDASAQAPKWRAGFGYEFLDRPDGFRGLASAYNLRFAEPPRVMDLSLIYRALADGQVDLIAGDATNGLIDALDLVMLDDNRRYFPPYDAVPIVRTSTLLAYPRLTDALRRLEGKVTVQEIRRMNYAVDVERRDATDVAREFIDRALR